MDNRFTTIETEFDANGQCTYLVLCFIRGYDDPVTIQCFSELSDARRFTRYWCNGEK